MLIEEHYLGNRNHTKQDRIWPSSSVFQPLESKFGKIISWLRHWSHIIAVWYLALLVCCRAIFISSKIRSYLIWFSWSSYIPTGHWRSFWFLTRIYIYGPVSKVPFLTSLFQIAAVDLEFFIETWNRFCSKVYRSSFLGMYNFPYLRHIFWPLYLL